LKGLKRTCVRQKSVLNKMPEESRDVLSRAQAIYKNMPEGGLFSGLNWLIAAEPFELDKKTYLEIETLGRVLLQFYRAANLLYRRSVEGKQPKWVADVLDKGKPEEIVQLQRRVIFKNELPRVIRPDLLITDEGLCLTELDSVPGGIGLTAWLNKNYSIENSTVIGGKTGMLDGFSSIFDDVNRVKIVVSEESSTYLPEMKWLAHQLGERFTVHSTDYFDFQKGEAVYRFFELFDYKNVNNFNLLAQLVVNGEITITPPFKSYLEEKMFLALLWNRNLKEFWRKELGEAFFDRMLKIVPYGWIIDPTPLPPQGAYPKIELTDWSQLKTLSQKQRNLILKVSGFSELAWGARGVFLGSDLSSEEWGKAVDTAINSFDKNPYILQEYKKPKRVKAIGFNPVNNELIEFEGRVRISPYYFVSGKLEQARVKLGGILATICPADKKIIHGMRDSILAPCCVEN